jgi:hypothetical protein
MEATERDVQNGTPGRCRPRANDESMTQSTVQAREAIAWSVHPLSGCFKFPEALMCLRPAPQPDRPLQEPALLRAAKLLDHLPDAGVPFRPVDSNDAHHSN